MMSRDSETVRLAELRIKKILDERSILEGTKEEGKAEGKIEGIIEMLSKTGIVSKKIGRIKLT